MKRDCPKKHDMQYLVQIHGKMRENLVILFSSMV